MDKWLWHARFYKTRTLAASQVSAGHVRLNGDKIQKRATMVTVDDVLTFAQGDHIRVIKVLGIGTRRGPAPEAQTLYEDLDPPQPKSKADIPNTPKFEGKGRPTGRDRRKLDLNRKAHLE